MWSGDLNQEIINSIYLYGDNKNITNSLSFLRDETAEDEWMNQIPSYSAWWIINLCDYYRLTGNEAYFNENRDYALSLLKRFNNCITEEGEIDFGLPPQAMSFYLDWPTRGTEDALIGTVAVILVAARKYLSIEANTNCDDLIRKLTRYLDAPCEYKQTRAFQILAGRVADGEAEFLEKGGAAGFSTFTLSWMGFGRFSICH